MTSGVVAKRYARALFDVAAERNRLDAVEEQLEEIVQLFRTNREFHRFLTHPLIPAEEKKAFIDRLAGNVWVEELRNLLHLLIDRGRMNALPAIAEVYRRLASEARGVVDAEVTTAVPLGQEVQETIADRLGRAIGKRVRVTNVVDPAILGGLVVRIGNRVIDGSVRSQLNRFQQTLVRTGSQLQQIQG